LSATEVVNAVRGYVGKGVKLMATPMTDFDLETADAMA